MKHPRWLGIGFFIIAVAVLFVVVYVFQPSAPPVTETVSVRSNITPPAMSPKLALHAEDTAQTAFFPIQTEVREQESTQAALIQQRDQLYWGFEQISLGLSQGQKPDLNQVQSMLFQQEQLVQAGVLKLEDALGYSQFLKQILPEIAGQIDLHISRLKRLNVVTG
ncbi:hypothetical protein [Acinetobacter sp. YH16053]|uniref:hypothetical protein n=1 Tax=Acinetobacter sp. YH16053 TaxID=2601192 RepID=UPI0015D40241|nr:hypothetical protein [Acinetobacter sp. YH16053]